MHLIFICAAVFVFSNADASRLPSSKMLICCLVGSTQKERMVGYSSLAEIRPCDFHNYRVAELAVIWLKFWFLGECEHYFCLGRTFPGDLWYVGPPVRHFTNAPLPNVASMLKQPFEVSAKMAENMKLVTCPKMFFGNLKITAKSARCLKPTWKKRILMN